MSADLRNHSHDPDDPLSGTESVDARITAGTNGDGSDAEPIDARADRVAVEPSTPIERRIERARLRARIAALERELAESERRRRAVIDQYERILQGRTGGESSATDAADRSVLRRLTDRLGR